MSLPLKIKPKPKFFRGHVSFRESISTFRKPRIERKGPANKKMFSMIVKTSFFSSGQISSRCADQNLGGGSLAMKEFYHTPIAPCHYSFYSDMAS